MKSEYTKELLLAAISGTILFFLMTAFCITYIIIYRRKRKEHQEEIDVSRKDFQQQLKQSQIEVQEHTYNVLSKELHDNIGQLLSTSRMLLGLTERTLADPPETLLTANTTLGQAISELRTLSRSLDKEWLSQFSFSDNLATEIARINNTGSLISAVFRYDDHLTLQSDEQIILFRIVQEGIQNSIKHAHPSMIEVLVTGEGQHIIIIIGDNGTGFNPATAVSGMGLLNMKHRTTLLGGTINWNSTPGKGTTVHISLPLKYPAA